MTALVNTSDLWQSCQMVGPSTGPCRMTSGLVRKRSPRPLGETASKAGTGNFSFSSSLPALINSNAMYRVISFDIDAGGKGISAFFDKRTVPDV